MSLPAALVPLAIDLIEAMIKAGHDPAKEIPRLKLSYEAQIRIDEDREKALSARFGPRKAKP